MRYAFRKWTKSRRIKGRQAQTKKRQAQIKRRLVRMMAAALIVMLGVFGFYGQADAENQGTGLDGISTETEETDVLEQFGDLSEIESAITQLLTVNASFSFRELLTELAQGDLQAVGDQIWQLVRDAFAGGLYENQALLFKIAGLAVIGAIFTNFAMAFSKAQVAETGFYLTYTLLMTLLMSSFVMTASIVSSVLQALTGFMKVLLPTFTLALTVTTGSLLGGAYYELMMAAIAIADWFMANVLMRLIQVYILTALVNQLSKEDYLSKLTELLATLIKWSVRTVVGIILGINVMQTMLLPAIDRAKGTIAYKLISAVPGVGSAMNAAAGAVIGSGVMIRNVLGVGGLIVILCLCVTPIVRVCFVWLSYRIVQAVIQPVSDQRLLEGIEAMTQGVSMLLGVLFGCVLMFILSLAVVCNATTILS